MNLSSQSALMESSSPGRGFLSEFGWFASGAVLPMGSLGYYRAASRRSVGLAILFFSVFTILISILTTISVGVGMVGVVAQIREAYQQGRIPDITIKGGVAQVDGAQPWIILEDHVRSESMFVAVDTSGRIASIDTSLYRQGFLLTRTELHMLTTTQGYQRVPLSEINAAFERDPIVINENTVADAWVKLSAITAVLAFLFLVLWNCVVRLMIIAFLALIFWGMASLFRPKLGFGPFIITGLYAIVPAIYLSHVFTRSQASFFGLQTILLILFWAAGLTAALSQDRFFTVEKDLRLWTAALGAPMILWFIVDMFAELPSPGALIALWSITLLTGLVLAGLRLFFHLQDMQKSEQAAALQPPGPPAA